MNNFRKINQGFICKNCKTKIFPVEKTCRNHCPKCLFSLHLDHEIPGDRKSNCHSLMEPVKIDASGKKGWLIIHKCKNCGKTISNQAAPDDNFELIIKLSLMTCP